VHHLVKYGKRAPRAIVQRPKAIVHLLGPDQHPFATFLGKPYCARDNVDGQSGGKFRDGTESALGHQPVDDLLRLGDDIGP
jgi:hypothetical protein